MGFLEKGCATRLALYTVNGKATASKPNRASKSVKGCMSRHCRCREYLTEKTLEVRLKLAHTNQSGGGAITVQHLDGGVFDSIVFAGRKNNSAGCPAAMDSCAPNHSRLQQTNGRIVSLLPLRSSTAPMAPSWVIVTVNRMENRIAVMARFDLKPVNAGRFCFRHAPVGGNRSLAATIASARLYDRALSPDEIAAAAQASGVFVTEAELLAQLTEDQRRQRQGLREDLQRIQPQLTEQEKTAKQKMYRN